MFLSDKLKQLLLLIGLMVIGLPKQCCALEFVGEAVVGAIKLVGNGVKAAKDGFDDMNQRRKDEFARKAEAINRLAVGGDDSVFYVDAAGNNQYLYKRQLKELQDDLLREQRENRAFGNDVDNLALAAGKVLLAAGNGVANLPGEQLRQAGETERFALQANADRKKHQDTLKTVADFLKEPKNLGYIGLTVVGVVGGAWLLKKTIDISANEVEKRLGRPEIIKESSYLNLWERIKGKKPEPSRIQEFIADATLKDRCDEIFHTVKNAFASGHYLGNMIFYGPPGTGKTFFAKELAIASGLEWAIVPGPALSKLETKEALIELDKLFAWANNSKTGMILVFDEAERFLPSRSNQNISEGTAKLVTEFLAYIEKPINKKLMIVLTTNRPGDLDGAVQSRILDSLYFAAPAAEQRVDLFKIYSKKLLPFGVALCDDLEAALPEIAKTSEGLVGRDIEAICLARAMRKLDTLGSKMLTGNLLRDVTLIHIEDKKKMQNFQAKV